MENNEDRIDVREELEFLESFINSSEKQINLLTQGIEDYGKALSVLQSKEVSESSENLISLGGGVFARGRIEREKEVMVAVGSDIFIEEKPERTIERLKGQIEEVRKSLQSLNDQRAEALRRYQAIVQSVNSSQKQDVS
ncbi:prefoldin subunit alpha [Cuniculiplasma divulgatum]|jgi:prefoldin alpha subunit|uniref:Prefoldin subunit alpha n=1 Tax=Cuniculiplasma divulgatum TaxID=1673428 RepID=A0A1N5T4A8_9ARCH|nr:prefoldin subunit alpha [Cuniculiplasma divulgatum]MCI2412461.1 prefoldin subunit alpha [Cuniculiplasma sp.]MCL4319662.1 prefoldin subunit alpha [Candidatus Thermoplasmatota archaeon]OWP54819.1 MAG: prefoldin subunit alpha [Cuniculiplasma sp. C_DKE]WMT48655.1 MAG: prefoldin subunit alpha [Thermoplasmatales archaeon]SIM43186.1 prefoldin subunit alpha [Cuniculiplasma divulgatum]